MAGNHIPVEEFRKRRIQARNQPTTTKRNPESLMQERCVTWFRYNHPQYRQLLFSVPNGGFRSPQIGYQMKKEGMTKGVADLLLLVPSRQWHGLAIELKTPEGELSAEQLDWGKDVMESGYLFVVVRSYEGFVELVRGYLGL